VSGLHVLLGTPKGDPTLSIRADEAEESWRIVEPILGAWEQGRVPLPTSTRQARRVLVERRFTPDPVDSGRYSAVGSVAGRRSSFCVRSRRASLPFGSLLSR
jgi:hypothetical protein